MGQFLGFTQLEGTLPVTELVRASGTPINLDAAPTYRVYGHTGLVPGGTGTLTFQDQGAILACTNASPIAVSSAGHGLTTGTRITITGVTGNVAANGTWIVTKVDANTFTLGGSTGNGAYLGGGAWNVTGLYTTTLTCASANGYEAGATYSLLVQGTIAGVAYADLSTFVVT